VAGRLRRSYERLRQSDERIINSRIGWLLPGGAAFKLGQRAGRRGSQRSHWWLLLTGDWLNWWNYNVGRDRAAAEQPAREE
jgi:hypothetical protein